MREPTTNEIAPLLADVRAGKPTEALRNALAPLLLHHRDRYLGMAFELLSKSLDELASDHSIPASEVVEYVRRKTAFAPKAQRDQDLAIVAIPESTLRTRAANGQHVPRVQQADDSLSTDSVGAVRVGRRWVQSHRPRVKIGTPDPRQERDELRFYARTQHEWDVAVLTDMTAEQIAADLDKSLASIRKTLTTLRNRAGFSYPECK
jgi:hypothetical protein